jgi:uncharacterized membrane protein
MGGYPDASHSNESRLLAALCYLFLVVGPVLILLTDLRRQHFLRYHAYQGLAVGIALLVMYLLVLPLGAWILLNVPCIGWTFACLAPFLYLAGLGLQLYWAYLAYQGQTFSIPILGNIVIASMRE